MLHSVWDQTRVVAIVSVTEILGLERVLEAVYGQTRRPDTVLAVLHPSLADPEQARRVLGAHGVPVAEQPEPTATARQAPAAGGHSVAALTAQVAAALLLEPDDGSPAEPAEPAPAAEGPEGLAIQQEDGTGAPPGADDVRGQWLWLLRSDTAPSVEALERLLAVVETSPSVAVAGCKQVEWDDEQRLLDVGITTSRLGAVITGLDRGELDQGQHDLRSDVLAVRTGGMLVRRDVWADLGGPDRALTGAHDDLEFCRRVHLCGHRVVVVPGAVIAAASTSACQGLRAERRDALLLRLVWTRWWLVPAAVVWSVLAGLVRSLTRLVMKQPGDSLDELLCAAEVLLRPARWIGARRRIRRVRSVPVSAVRPLGASGRALARQRRDEITSWIRPSSRSRPSLPGVVTPPPGRRVARLALVGLPALIAGLLSGRHLLRGGASTDLVSGVLPPMPNSAGQLWTSATGSWRPIGLGVSAGADPAAGLLALLSLPLGDPGRLVGLLLLAGPALAAAIAFAVTASLTGSRPTRWFVALTWSAAPSLWAAVTTGRPTAVLVHLLLPVLALTCWRALAGGSIAAAAAAGLVLTAVIAAAPITAPALVVMLGLAGAVAVALHGWRRVPVAALALVPPAALLLPWWVAVARRPRLLLADVGDWAGTPSAPWWHLLLLPEGPEQVFSLGGPPADLIGSTYLSQAIGQPLPPVVGDLPVSVVIAVVVALALAAVVILLASLALLRRGRPGVVAILGWLTALAGLGMALAGERLSPAGRPTWSGPAMSLAMLGLLMGAVVALPRLGRRVRTARAWRRRLLTPLLAAVAVPAAVALIVVATGPAPNQPDAVRRARTDVLPTVVSAEGSGPGATRTLVLVADGQRIRWSIARGGVQRWGEDSAERRLDTRAVSRADAVVLPVLSGLLSPAPRDVRAGLAELGVGSVVLLEPLNETVQQALDGAPGLVRVNAGTARAMWRVDPVAGDRVSSRAHRVRVVEADGTVSAVLPSSEDGVGVDTDLPAGRAGRRVVLADATDPGWQATYNGVALAGEPAGRSGGSAWAQAFLLPAQAGNLRIEHRGPAPWVESSWANGSRAAVGVLAILLALPLPTVRRRIAPPPAPRATHPVERDPDAVSEVRPAPRIFDLDHPEDGELPALGVPLGLIDATRPSAPGEVADRDEPTGPAEPQRPDEPRDPDGPHHPDGPDEPSLRPS